MKARLMVTGVVLAALTVSVAGMAESGGPQQSGNNQQGQKPPGLQAQPPGQVMPQPAVPSVGPAMDAGETASVGTGHIGAEQDRARNVERQKKLVEDTQKLLTLANELKADVDKTDRNMLSVDVIKKADEIEKLAHSVKEKMKGS